MRGAYLDKELSTYECKKETETYSFLTSLSDIQDSTSNEEDNRVGSLFSEDSLTFESSDVSIRLFSLGLNATNENENGNDNAMKIIVPPKAEQRKGERRSKKIPRSVALLPENSTKCLVESSFDSSRDYGPVSYTHLDVYKRQELYYGG